MTALETSARNALGTLSGLIESASQQTLADAIAEMLADEDFTRKMLSSYIIRRVGEPTDAAGLVTFLASSAADWITAQTYPVNGGFSVSQ